MSKDYDPTDLLGQERDRTAEDARKRMAQRIEEGDLLWLMGQKRGRAFLWKWLSEARVFHPSFDMNSMKMAFNEGNRSYGLKLLTEIMTVCPELFLKMQNEVVKNVRNDDGNADHSN